MEPSCEDRATVLTAVANALVRFHKQHYGRGPVRAHSHFAGPDALVCVLENVLLPAERKLVAMGEHEIVHDSRRALTVATHDELTSTVELIVQRTVRAFATTIDPRADIVFEHFLFEPQSSAAPRDDA